MVIQEERGEGPLNICSRRRSPNLSFKLISVQHKDTFRSPDHLGFGWVGKRPQAGGRFLNLLFLLPLGWVALPTDRPTLTRGQGMSGEERRLLFEPRDLSEECSSWFALCESEFCGEDDSHAMQVMSWLGACRAPTTPSEFSNPRPMGNLLEALCG